MSSKVLFLGALIETSFSLRSRITLTQDEAFLQAHSAFEPERDYKVAETGLKPTRLRPKRSMLSLNITPPLILPILTYKKNFNNFFMNSQCYVMSPVKRTH